MSSGTAIVEVCVQNTEFLWYWDIGPSVGWQLFAAEEPEWSESVKNPVVYPIITHTKSQKFFNHIDSKVLLFELRPFGATKKGKQKNTTHHW